MIYFGIQFSFLDSRTKWIFIAQYVKIIGAISLSFPVIETN